jgi:hypothetical protein
MHCSSRCPASLTEALWTVLPDPTRRMPDPYKHPDHAASAAWHFTFSGPLWQVIVLLGIDEPCHLSHFRGGTGVLPRNHGTNRLACLVDRDGDRALGREPYGTDLLGINA